MDNLEDFIRSNKEKFDSKTPNTNVWDRIKTDRETESTAATVQHKRYSLPIRAMKIAASFFILILASYGGYKILTPVPQSRIANEVRLPTDVIEIAQYYDSKVVGQFAEVELLLDDQEIINEVKEELEMLDQEKTKLLTEYNQNIDKKQIIEALINTYRMKLKVLENIITLLDENPNEENTII